MKLSEISFVKIGRQKWSKDLSMGKGYTLFQRMPKTIWILCFRPLHQCNKITKIRNEVFFLLISGTKRNSFVSENSKNPYILLKQETKWFRSVSFRSVSFLVLVLPYPYCYFQERNSSVPFRFISFRSVSFLFRFVPFRFLF